MNPHGVSGESARQGAYRGQGLRDGGRRRRRIPLQCVMSGQSGHSVRQPWLMRGHGHGHWGAVTAHGHFGGARRKLAREADDGIEGVVLTGRREP